MSLLAQLTTDNSIQGEKDSLGGGNRVLDTDLYLFTVIHAYVITSDGGAMGLVLQLKSDAGELRSTQWMTSGTAKGGKNYYEKDGQKNYLPGFLMADALALMTTGKNISALDTEDKMIKVWDGTAKAEVPKKVPMVMELLGKQVWAGVFKQTVDKNVKDAAGNYVPSGETREENELDKFFHGESKLTVAEAKAGATEPVFFGQWKEKWAGKVRDRSTKGAKAPAGAAAAQGTPGLFGGGAKAPVANGAAGKPTSSLFA